MKSLLFIIAFAACFARATAGEPTALPAQADGTIIKDENGFPFTSYEQWVARVRSQIVFDEQSIRAKYPPEKFQEYKEKQNIPVDTYEAWLAGMKRRMELMQARWPSIEAEMRKASPPEQFREFTATVECRRIVYLSDGQKIEGFILKPAAAIAGRLPVIIYNHGGNSQVGSLDERSLMRVGWLVRAGYVVVASQYRGCGGSEGQDEMGGADIADVLNLFPVIASLPYADAARIGMFGWSRGGMMTFLALARTDRIAAAVIGSAPTDISTEIDKRPEMERLLQRSVPGYAEHKEAALKARSAQHWPEKLCKTTPLLLLHGSDDKRCDPAEALEMAMMLYRSGCHFRFVFFESGDHGLTQHTGETNRLIIAWFEKYLGNSGKPAAIHGDQ
jgi:dipeptidyl aminopeptidase/acylaminoacyl peptidase